MTSIDSSQYCLAAFVSASPASYKQRTVMFCRQAFQIRQITFPYSVTDVTVGEADLRYET